MAIELPPGLAGYWGPIVSAASQRLGIGGAFSAVNEARAAAELAPLTGVDAIAMGRVYSLAVQQRNAGEAFQKAITALDNATGATRSALYNASIDASLVTETISSGPTDLQFTAPQFRLQYGVTSNEGTSYRWISLGDQIPQSIGEVWDLINERNGLVDATYGTDTTPTGFVNVFMV